MARHRGRHDLVWYYAEPLAEVGRIAGLLCFFNERVDIELDGELQERPESPWSHGVKSDAANAPAGQSAASPSGEHHLGADEVGR